MKLPSEGSNGYKRSMAVCYNACHLQSSASTHLEAGHTPHLLCEGPCSNSHNVPSSSTDRCLSSYLVTGAARVGLARALRSALVLARRNSLGVVLDGTGQDRTGDGQNLSRDSAVDLEKPYSTGTVRTYRGAALVPCDPHPLGLGAGFTLPDQGVSPVSSLQSPVSGNRTESNATQHNLVKKKPRHLQLSARYLDRTSAFAPPAVRCWPTCETLSIGTKTLAAASFLPCLARPYIAHTSHLAPSTPTSLLTSVAFSPSLPTFIFSPFQSFVCAQSAIRVPRVSLCFLRRLIGRASSAVYRLSNLGLAKLRPPALIRDRESLSNTRGGDNNTTAATHGLRRTSRPRSSH
ncbi:hypothetical protein FDECE_1704 [Fusarium decemcellulare]|nr:hypothetical protein FDECE_1704 [Fusarium decemcellulare]